MCFISSALNIGGSVFMGGNIRGSGRGGVRQSAINSKKWDAWGGCYLLKKWTRAWHAKNFSCLPEIDIRLLVFCIGKMMSYWEREREREREREWLVCIRTLRHRFNRFSIVLMVYMLFGRLHRLCSPEHNFQFPLSTCTCTADFTHGSYSMEFF